MKSITSLFCVATVVAAATGVAFAAPVTVRKWQYQPPTIQLTGNRIAAHTAVTLTGSRPRPMPATVKGRIRQGKHDRLYLVTGQLEHFTVPTHDFTGAGMQIDMPALDLGPMALGRPVSGRALAKTLARSQGNKTIREIDPRNYELMKALIDARKTVVAEANATTSGRLAGWEHKRWDPETNQTQVIDVPDISSRSGSQPRGFVVTSVHDTGKTYPPDRWIHTFFDPQSESFTGSGSSTLRYPNTILHAWVLE